MDIKVNTDIVLVNDIDNDIDIEIDLAQSWSCRLKYYSWLLKISIQNITYINNQ